MAEDGISGGAGPSLGTKKVRVINDTTIIHDDVVYTEGDEFETDARVAVSWFLAKQVDFV